MGTEVPPYTVREYEPGDEHAVLATFNRVFSELDPGFVPRTLESWRWLYLDNPSGWRIYLAVTDDDGRVISQYAGVRQRMLLEGEPACFSQAVDSMTDPAFRRGLKRPGFFVLTGYPYASNYGGPSPDGDVVMWGLPLPAAWRVGKGFLKYQLIRVQNKLVADPARLDGSAGGVEVEEVGEFPEEVDVLSERAGAEHGAIAVRDKAQLDWRFRDNPDNDYAIALARRGAELLGYAVYRFGTFDREESGLVCDWLVPGGEGAVAVALRAWLAERARRDSAERLAAVFPDTVGEWLAFQRAGFRVHPTHYFVVGRSYVPRYRMPWLHQHWYYTLGDSDLC